MIGDRASRSRIALHDLTVTTAVSLFRLSLTEIRKSNAQPALNILRLFVERFVASEIKTLRNLLPNRARSDLLVLDSHDRLSVNGAIRP